MNNKALGLIEVYGYVGAVEACDCALKSADVKLIDCEKISGGIVTAKVIGDVSAVESAVIAASESTKRLGSYRAHHIIPRLADGIDNILFDKIDYKEDLEESNNVPDLISDDSIKEHESNLGSTFNKQIYDKETLLNMTVNDLRKIARDLKISSMTKKEIRYAKKEKLIFNILKHFGEEV